MVYLGAEVCQRLDEDRPGYCRALLAGDREEESRRHINRGQHSLAPAHIEHQGTHIRSYSIVHTYTHTYIHGEMKLRMNKQIHTYKYFKLKQNMHEITKIKILTVYVHAYMHTYIHTYIRTCCVHTRTGSKPFVASRP